MLIVTGKARTVDERDVVAVYPGGGDHRHTFAVLVMSNGTEIEWAVPNDALARIEAEIADPMLPAA